jgi:hypothetical protein
MDLSHTCNKILGPDQEPYWPSRGVEVLSYATDRECEARYREREGGNAREGQAHTLTCHRPGFN